MDIVTKICTKCNIEKEIENFAFRKRSKNKQAWCKDCSSENNKLWYLNNKERKGDYGKAYNQSHVYEMRLTRYKRRYGISREDFERMLSSQNGLCGICKCSLEDSLVVDHNHKNGKVRELLCYKCNTGLGLVDDNIEILQKFKEYIKKHD